MVTPDWLREVAALRAAGEIRFDALMGGYLQRVVEEVREVRGAPDTLFRVVVTAAPNPTSWVPVAGTAPWRGLVYAAAADTLVECLGHVWRGDALEQARTQVGAVPLLGSARWVWHRAPNAERAALAVVGSAEDAARL